MYWRSSQGITICSIEALTIGAILPTSSVTQDRRILNINAYVHEWKFTAGLSYLYSAKTYGSRILKIKFTAILSWNFVKSLLPVCIQSPWILLNMLRITFTEILWNYDNFSQNWTLWILRECNWNHNLDYYIIIKLGK